MTADATVVMPRNVFARLPSYNPFVGTFHHAPSAGNRGAVYFSGEIMGVSELEERKKVRHHPLTGTFHCFPGYYDPLHQLSQFRAPEERWSDTASVRSMRSFVAVDLADTDDPESSTHGVFRAKPKMLSRMYSDSSCLRDGDIWARPRRFSDSDRDTAFSAAAYHAASTSSTPRNLANFPLPYVSGHVDEVDEEVISTSSASSSPASPSRKRVSSEDSFSFRRPQKSYDSLLECESDALDVLLRSERGPLTRMSSAELNSGFISTGKGIFRKMGYRTSQKPQPKPKYPPREDPEDSRLSDEYNQMAPRLPLNPFVARRLTDGDRIEILAIQRGARRDSVPTVLHPGSDSEEDASNHPKPYFIHEKAVTEHYDLCGEDQLGDGSYAVVKPAIRRSDNREVAIKQIHKRYLRTEESKSAVDREIEIHLRLRHKHIVRLYEVYETADFLYLVMAKATKGNLKALMERKRRLPEALAAKLAQQIVRAVFFLHDSGVLHCDLKPENILLSDAKAVKEEDGHSPKTKSMDPHADVKVSDYSIEICDFGLSVKVPDVRFYKLTGDVHKVPFSGVTGTPGYIAPELLQQHAYGKPVDMWSVGTIIYEMLTGFQPFYPPHACIEEDADWNPVIWKRISQPAQDLVRKLLEKDPSKRLTAAQALSHDWFESPTFAL